MNRRASSAPLYSRCPAAAYGQDDPVAIDRVDEYGTFGTAVHEAGAKIVQGIEFDTAELASRYGLDDAAKRRMLYMVGVIFRWCAKHGETFCQDDGTLRVLDWKTTRLKEVDYSPQLMEYLYLLLMTPKPNAPPLLVEYELEYGDYSGHPDVAFVPSNEDGPSGCQYIVLFLEDQTHTVSPVLTPRAVDEWHDAYVNALDSWDGRTFNPGGHCWYCSRCASCHGLRTELAFVGQHYIMTNPETAVLALTPAEQVKLWERIGAAQKWCDRVREIIKLQASANGNLLEGDGRKLVIEEQIRHPLKALESWPVLKEYLTDEELAPAVSISKGTVLGAIAAKAPCGMKGKVKQEVEEKLEAAGAFEEERVLFPRIVSAGASEEKQIEGA